MKVLSKTRARKKHKRRMRRNPGLCTVYGLYDQSGSLFYIGQTRLMLSERLKMFLNKIKKQGASSPVEKWIAANEAAIEIRAIDENGTWDVSEIIYIDRAKREGVQLLNILRGGQDNLRDLKREMSGVYR